MQEDWNAFANATASVEAASGKEPAPGIVQMASEASKSLSKLPVDWVECAVWSLRLGMWGPGLGLGSWVGT